MSELKLSQKKTCNGCRALSTIYHQCDFGLPTRAQKRYQEWKQSEANESFAEWLGVDAATMSWKRTMRQLGYRT